MSQAISDYYSKDNVLKIWIDFYTKVYEEHQVNLNGKKRRKKAKSKKEK